MIKKIAKSYIFYITSAFGISLTIKANVGVSSFNSMNVALSNALSIKVGTITIIFNLIFLIVYMYLTHFTLINKYALQAFTALMFGIFINFFTYTVLCGLSTDNYYIQILLIAIGTIIGGASVGMIVSYDAITFPIESCCLELAKICSFSFITLRYSIDIFSIATSIVTSLAFALPLYVREGTIISMILLSASIDFTKQIYAKINNFSTI